MNEKELKLLLANWFIRNTGFIKVSEDTYEIATTEIDSYGDTVYCFVTKKDNLYEISDDGRLLFKLDPGMQNSELIATAKDIVIGSGYDFNPDNAMISVMTDKENLPQAIIRLSQLQVAISYLN